MLLILGAVSFRVKRYNRVRSILPQCAVLFVSHNMFDIARGSTGGLVLLKGKSSGIFGIEPGTQKYNECYFEDNCAGKFTVHVDADHKNVGVEEVDVDCAGVNANVNIRMTFYSSIRDRIQVRLIFFDNNESAVAEWESDIHKRTIQEECRNNSLAICVEGLHLK